METHADSPQEIAACLSSPFISVHDPSCIWPRLDPMLQDALPFRNTRWTDPLNRRHLMRRIYPHMLPFNNDHVHSRAPLADECYEPLAFLYILQCNDVDHYKDVVRKEIADWVELVSTTNIDYLILYVGPPDDRRVRLRRSMFDRVRSDFGSKRKKEPCHCVQLQEAPLIASASSVDIDDTQSDVSLAPVRWTSDALMALRSAMISTFSRRHARYQEALQSAIAARKEPDWDYLDFFALKEGLALALEMMGLYRDAVQQYDELEVVLDDTHAVGTRSAASYFCLPLVSAPSPSSPPSAKDAQGFSAGLYTEEIARVLDGILYNCSILDGGGAEAFEQRRELICTRSISPFQLLVYMHANRARLLLAQSESIVMAERALVFIADTSAPLRHTCGDEFTDAWRFSTAMEVADRCRQLRGHLLDPSMSRIRETEQEAEDSGAQDDGAAPERRRSARFTASFLDVLSSKRRRASRANLLATAAALEADESFSESLDRIGEGRTRNEFELLDSVERRLLYVALQALSALGVLFGHLPRRQPFSSDTRAHSLAQLDFTVEQLHETNWHATIEASTTSGAQQCRSFSFPSADARILTALTDASAFDRLLVSVATRALSRNVRSRVTAHAQTLLGALYIVRERYADAQPLLELASSEFALQGWSVLQRDSCWLLSVCQWRLKQYSSFVLSSLRLAVPSPLRPSSQTAPFLHQALSTAQTYGATMSTVSIPLSQLGCSARIVSATAQEDHESSDDHEESTRSWNGGVAPPLRRRTSVSEAIVKGGRVVSVVVALNWALPERVERVLCSLVTHRSQLVEQSRRRFAATGSRRVSVAALCTAAVSLLGNDTKKRMGDVEEEEEEEEEEEGDAIGGNDNATNEDDDGVDTADASIELHEAGDTVETDMSGRLVFECTLDVVVPGENRLLFECVFPDPPAGTQVEYVLDRLRVAVGGLVLDHQVRDVGRDTRLVLVNSSKQSLRVLADDRRVLLADTTHLLKWTVHPGEGNASDVRVSVVAMYDAEDEGNDNAMTVQGDVTIVDDATLAVLSSHALSATSYYSIGNLTAHSPVRCALPVSFTRPGRFVVHWTVTSKKATVTSAETAITVLEPLQCQWSLRQLAHRHAVAVSLVNTATEPLRVDAVSLLDSACVVEPPPELSLALPAHVQPGALTSLLWWLPQIPTQLTLNATFVLQTPNGGSCTMSFRHTVE